MFGAGIVVWDGLNNEESFLICLTCLLMFSSSSSSSSSRSDLLYIGNFAEQSFRGPRLDQPGIGRGAGELAA